MDSVSEKILLENFTSEISIEFVNYKGMFVPGTYQLIAEQVENFEVRDDDVWVVSFPKSGTTWTQEMVWLIANDLDFEGAKISQLERFPFFESLGTTVRGWATYKKFQNKHPESLSKTIKNIDELTSPRFIKTHLPFHLLPRQLRQREKKAKIVYVSRNPKDTCISYYYHYKFLEAYCGTFKNFCELFLQGKVLYAPYWDHFNGYWKKKDDENILRLKYEDMKEDFPLILNKVARFLGKELSDEQLKKLEHHLSFSNMKINPAVNYEARVKFLNEFKLFGENFLCQGDFIRKGVAGQWKDEMTSEQIKQFDDWSNENLKKFPHLQNDFI